jgi:hypothetical protein
MIDNLRRRNMKNLTAFLLVMSLTPIYASEETTILNMIYSREANIKLALLHPESIAKTDNSKAEYKRIIQEGATHHSSFALLKTAWNLWYYHAESRDEDLYANLYKNIARDSTLSSELRLLAAQLLTDYDFQSSYQVYCDIADHPDTSIRLLHEVSESMGWLWEIPEMHKKLVSILKIISGSTAEEDKEYKERADHLLSQVAHL